MTGDTEVPEGAIGAPPAPAGARAPDVLDGGAGEDGVAYRGRRAPLTIDLTKGTGGEAGEGDTLIGIEEVIGGLGADAIAGTAGADDLDGLAGRDTLLGLGGDDVLRSGARVDAGPGDDEVHEPGRRLVCGAGDDVVETARVLPGGCERVWLDFDTSVAARPRLRRGAVVLALRSACRCPALARFTVRARAKLLARGRVRLARVGRATARLALTPDGRRLLRRRGRTVTITSRPPFGTRWRAVIGT